MIKHCKLYIETDNMKLKISFPLHLFFKETKKILRRVNQSWQASRNYLTITGIDQRDGGLYKQESLSFKNYTMTEKQKELVDIF